jgi:hypothetical protein
MVRVSLVWVSGMSSCSLKKGSKEGGGLGL